MLARTVIGVALLCGVGCSSRAVGGDADGGQGSDGGEVGDTGDDGADGGDDGADGGDDGADGGDGETHEIQVSCNRPPTGAIDADYDAGGTHEITASGGNGFYMWSATGLPAGLLLNDGDPNFVSLVGNITGQPTERGSFDVEIAVIDADGGFGTATCDIEINERFELIPFPDPPHMPCVIPGEKLDEIYVPPGRGDGSPITCNLPEGWRGNGEKPDGVDVVDCQITGAPTGSHADRYGTWAWIVEAEQSGVVLHVPFCYTTFANPGTYEVRVYRGGDLTTDTALVPGTGTFNATEPFGWGDTDPSDPRFEIASADDCAPDTCYYGLTWATSAPSPFDFETLYLNDDAVLRDDTGQPVGLTHGLQVSGQPGPIDPDFANRVWILSIRITYCIADNDGGAANDDGPCEGGSNVAENSGTLMEFSIIMTPG